MSTPIERAAEAISHPGVRGMCDKGCECEDDLALTRWVARRTLAAALDVDELVVVIDLHREQYDGDCGMYFGCDCGWDNGTDEHNDGYSEHVARDLVEHLTKGDENDE